MRDLRDLHVLDVVHTRCAEPVEVHPPLLPAIQGTRIKSENQEIREPVGVGRDIGSPGSFYRGGHCRAP
jgi:hypothetical protein